VTPPVASRVDPAGRGDGAVPRLIVEADGGARGNPGPAGYGAVVVDPVSGEVLAEIAEPIGHATNNVAEYRGLIAGLQAAARLAPGAAVEVRMDSKLVVEQMSGRWQIKHPSLRPLARAAREAARGLGRVSYMWVPRERNRRADKLANDAMDSSKRLPRGAPKPERSAPPGQPPARADLDARPPAARADTQPTQSMAPAQAAVPADLAGQNARVASGWAGRDARSGRAMTTVLLRHGQTALSVDRRFAGTSDVDLTDLGAVQAKAAAQRLARRGDGARIGVIVTSPLRRALQTAEEAARATGAPLRVEADLRETDFGAWEGLTFAEAQQKWPDEMAAWLAGANVAPPGGESFAEVEHRVLAALERLRAEQAGAVVVLVSHVTPIKTLVRHALLAPPVAMYRMHLDVACLCEIDWYADGPAVVRSLNDTAHLAGLA
jgi:ribonuclease H / adenosylcobalamin/alpha-ribazole phosphatase